MFFCFLLRNQTLISLTFDMYSSQEMTDTPIYLDNNATTAVDPEVLKAMLPYFTDLPGNAGSSGHTFGWAAEEAVEQAREEMADLIEATGQEIIFTAGATESINLVISNIKSGHIVTATTEHKAVLAACEAAESSGVRTTYLPVDEDGLIDLNLLQDSLEEDTSLICVMFANNETGTIQDVSGIADIAMEHGIPFMCDATQALGKVEVNVKGMSYLPCSAHKFYGPKGVGALYINKDISTRTMRPIIHGGAQERGLRSGTHNVPGIVGLGKACQIAKEQLTISNARIGKLRDILENQLLSIPGAAVNGNARSRLPNTCNISFENVEGQLVIEALGKEIALATGSACSAELVEPSHVLKHMGFSPERILGSLRISLGRYNTEGEIALAGERLTKVIAELCLV